MGFRRANGTVGVRNYLLVLSTVICANHVSKKIADAVPGTASFCHGNGCGQIGADKEQTQRTLEGIGKNPNVAAVLVVSLGCEGVSADRIVEEIRSTGKPVSLLRIQDCGGTSATIKLGTEIVSEWHQKYLIQERDEVDIAKLVLSLECGGSDATSGISSNPLVGWISDKLIDLGGTVILSETTEMIGAEHILSARACCSKVGEELIKIVNNVEHSANSMHVDLRGTQPTPGNIAGGLSTIEEKSLGCLAKAGSSSVNEVLQYGEMPKSNGLVIMDTPGFDVESIIGMLAGGSQIVLFTTGRGTPVGAPIAPVIKITGNPDVSLSMIENIDFDASPILRGTETLDELGEKLFAKLIAVISGEQTCSEILGHCEAGITRIGPSV
ncbi:MAG: UxaA family hydrolase [Sphaerochaetaceae bacterium]|nr:UxaA family hydrolase [Sphaerochaetaceae bacterium]